MQRQVNDAQQAYGQQSFASYKNADQIDWGDVLAYGAGIENCDYSQEAVDAYLEASDEFDAVEYDLIAL